MTVFAATIVDLALSQAGGEYLWGGKGAATDPNPAARHGLDCSGLIAWAVRRAGGSIPDGSASQWQYCRDGGGAVPVQAAEQTRGALLFEGLTPVHHVVLSLGDGRTIEARGAAYGIGVWPVANRPWTHGARIPGVVYDDAWNDPSPPPPSPRGVDVPWPGVYFRSTTPRMKGPFVRTIQELLGLNGYVVATDGVYGPQTRRAVTHYQRTHDLAPDGIVGPRTWSRLVGGA